VTARFYFTLFLPLRVIYSSSSFTLKSMNVFDDISTPFSHLGNTVHMKHIYLNAHPQSSVGSLPIFMVYPSHTPSTYPQSFDSPSLFVHMIMDDKLC
jgi:hypothetical protein